MTLSHVLLGIATGVPVMIVVGPVSLLLIEQGMKHGFRGGMPAAVGVGVTDLTFSMSAAVAGAAAARVLEPAQALLHFVAFGVLAWLAVVTWKAARRELLGLDGRILDGPIQPISRTASSHRPTASSSDEALTALHATLQVVPDVPAVMGSSVSTWGGRAALGADSWLARATAFFLITAANPITIVVFASLVVSGRDGIGSPGWVLGMTIASALVSSIYLAVGHGLGAVLSDAATARLRMGGSVVILGLGAWFALAG
jgi:threonine/homoserine/homoserine lactone efflux protein